MALMPIKKRQRVVGKSGKKSGAGTGQRIGAGLGAILGGVGAATVAAGAPPAAPSAIALGAAQGAALGGSVGGMAGGMIQPGRQDTRQLQSSGGPSLVETATQSQQLLSGIHSLEYLDPEIQTQMSKPLTEAYIASMVQLKNRERGMA